jgi:hypothetical protein
MEEKIDFAMKKGERDTGRLVKECLLAFSRALGDRQCLVGNRACEFKVITKEIGDSLMVDITNPSDEYDHIEFTITKTGWGRKL